MAESLSGRRAMVQSLFKGETAPAGCGKSGTKAHDAEGRIVLLFFGPVMMHVTEAAMFVQLPQRMAPFFSTEEDFSGP